MLQKPRITFVFLTVSLEGKFHGSQCLRTGSPWWPCPLSQLQQPATHKGKSICCCVLSQFRMLCYAMLSLQSWPMLCDPMDHSLPGSSVHGILQARILEWVAMPFLRGSSRPTDQTHIPYISSPLAPPDRGFQLFLIHLKKIWGFPDVNLVYENFKSIVLIFSFTISLLN